MRSLVAFSFALVAGGAFASPMGGPFGAGLPDTGGLPSFTMFPRFFGLLIEVQTWFNLHLTASIKATKHDSMAAWSLLAISFLYGVVHASGPGHGKAVVSSYVLANRQTLRNGIVLAFVASLAQAASAVALILIASLVLHSTSVSITKATYGFEIGSDVLVVLLGGWLVWTKVLSRIAAQRSLGASLFAPAPPTFVAAGATSAFHASEVFETPKPARVSAATVQEPCDCGGLHMPSAAAAAGQLDWRKAWSVVASTALRPCTGALIVLVFSLVQGVLPLGIIATFAMGLGTAITVAVLALLATALRGATVKLAGGRGLLAARLKIGFEIAASFAILAVGLLMLSANLAMR